MWNTGFESPAHTLTECEAGKILCGSNKVSLSYSVFSFYNKLNLAFCGETMSKYIIQSCEILNVLRHNGMRPWLLYTISDVYVTRTGKAKMLYFVLGVCDRMI